MKSNSPPRGLVLSGGTADRNHPPRAALGWHNGPMTTRERLHLLVDNMDDEQVERALLLVEPILHSGTTAADAGRQSLPAFVGSFDSGRHDLSQRVDELLTDGFGR
jgi:hypothetical protein